MTEILTIFLLSYTVHIETLIYIVMSQYVLLLLYYLWILNKYNKLLSFFHLQYS